MVLFIIGIFMLIAMVTVAVVLVKAKKGQYKKYNIITIPAGLFFTILFVLIPCFTSVSTGTTGVVTVFGKVEDKTYDAGFHMKAPWEKIVEMDNRVQKATVELSCFSSDIQEVQVIYTLNYQIDKANAQELYKNVGKEYYRTIIDPSIKEATKVASAHYTAEQLVQNRSDLATEIETLLEESLARYNIKISSTAIEDMDFTDAFTNAVEAKQVAEQKKKQAIIEQEQARLQAENEKEIARIKAEAEAEQAKIRAEADKNVAQIGADSAEYQGKKEAAIALQRLAAINGWTVKEEDGIYHVYKPNGTEVSDEELKVGAQTLISYYYIMQWDGKLPETYVGSEDFINMILALTGKTGG